MMKKKALWLVLLMLLSVVANAQKREVSGVMIDHDTHDVLPMVTVQLLKRDSSFVSGTVSGDDGKFMVQAPSSGVYLVKLSSVGYVTMVKRVQVKADGNVALGQVTLRSDAVMLKEAQVTAQALKVAVKEDTFVYNSSAYRTPEGSTIEELVKRLPGAQVGEDGKITINGKEVKKILIDGKEFMTGDTKTAMKNIPTSIINKIKAYDQRSDLSRVTGIDDGADETVLDFGTKAGMGKGLMANVDVGVGTEERYSSRLFGGYFDKQVRIFGMGNANNVNDMGFGGRGGFGRPRNGLNATKMAGLNMNYEKKDTLKIDGSVRWNHSDGDVYSRSSVENFVSRSGAFSNSLGQNYSRSNSFEAQARVEWTPDTLTNIMFRPRLSTSSNDGRTGEMSASYSADPYLYVVNPLDAETLTRLATDSVLVNTRQNQGISYSDNKSVGAMLQLNRRLNNMGRNVTLRADMSYGNGEERSLSANNVHLYQVRSMTGADSTYQTNRYTLTPTKNWSYSLQATYSEPLWKATFLQLSYSMKYSYNKSDRSTYDFSNLGEDYFAGVTSGYRQWDGYLSRLERPYTDYRSQNLSRYSEYRNYTHDIELMFRMIRQKYQLNAGVMLQPQTSRYLQDYQGVSVDTTRNVFNVAPTFDFRYRFNKVSNLRINYRANSSQPGISQLLDIVDDSDPLRITRGNPGLKPAFTQNFNLFYNGYFEKTQRSVMTFARFSTTNNAISNKVTYDEKTGGRTTRPENVNGNWTANLGLMLNTPLDSAGRWNVNTFSMLNYTHDVGFVQPNNMADALKSTTKSLMAMERLSGSYRNDWLEVELDGSVNYSHSRNPLQTTANLDTWTYSYGANVSLTLPWGMTVSTDAHENSRRGYNDAALNTNEFVWNAQIAQSFLKGKPLSVMLQFYDILKNQSNISRSLTAMQRSDTEYNAINSYVMLHVNYRLNLFGGKMGGPGMGQGGHGNFGGRGSRGGGFGRPRGGFGGPRF